MEPVTGTIDFVLDGETFKTAYKIFGDLKAPCPLLVLHGGPGIPHQYLLTFSALASKTRPVIFYDQIGCGLSTHLPNKPAEFWTVEMFMKELDNVIAQLLADTVFDLAGHSWGGMLGADYIISRLRRLILADAPASMELWSVGANLLLDHKFPAEFGDMLRKYERDASAKSQVRLWRLWRLGQDIEDGKDVTLLKTACLGQAKYIAWEDTSVLGRRRAS